MNNRGQLLKLRRQHNLTYADVAGICGVSVWTAKSWFLDPDSQSSRNKNDDNLTKYLDMVKDHFNEK